MNKLNIFKDNTEIDLEKLIETRLIFFANSGGGKSWAFRKLLEKIDNKIMVIIIDVEGEYKTLREKYDYLLIGGEGDIPINTKSAPLLPKKLFELNISTIIDISELKNKDRIHYVKTFLEALMELPKKLWKPCLVGIEETHKLCGQQDKHDSGPAVIDLFTRGRKRGLCGVAITQRIAKLHKDVVAECNNVFAGRMWLPNDIKTASQILGMSIQESMKILKNLDPGELFCFGPAINKNIHQGKIGKVKTTHPKIGIDLKKQITPPTDKIKNIISKLSKLPQKADEELIEKRNFIREIHDLKKKLSIANGTKDIKELQSSRSLTTSPGRMIAKIENELTKWKSQYATLKRAYEHNLVIIKKLEKREVTYNKGYNIIQEIYPLLQKLIPIERFTKSFINSWEKTTPFIEQIKAKARTEEGVKVGDNISFVDEASDIKDIEKLLKIEPTVKDGKGKLMILRTEPMLDKLPKAAGLLYKLLCDNPGRTFSTTQAAAILGYSPKAGHFNNTVYILTNKGLIKKERNMLIATEMKPELIEGLPNMELSLEFFKSKLPKAPRRIFEILLEHRDMEKEDIALELGYSENAGHFNNSIYKLTSMNIIKKEGSRLILNQELEKLI